jgi:L-amino acid N-acyltransferase
MIAIRPATEYDLPALFEILNREIESGVASFKTEVIGRTGQAAWWQLHLSDRYPVLVAQRTDVGAASAIVGWASLSAYSTFIGYARTAEVSVWVSPSEQGKGIGSMLYQQLLPLGARAGVRVALARIEAGNAASIRLHERSGFRFVGTLHHVGEKFGRLLDVAIYEKQLGPLA